MTKKIFKLHLKGIVASDIALQLGIDTATVTALLAE